MAFCFCPIGFMYSLFNSLYTLLSSSSLALEKYCLTSSYSTSSHGGPGVFFRSRLLISLTFPILKLIFFPLQLLDLFFLFSFCFFCLLLAFLSFVLLVYPHCKTL